MNIAIYPGSFDPITKGHLDIIKKSSKIFKKTYIVIANNRKKEHMFSMKERADFVKAAVKNIKNIEIITYEGIISNLAKELKANIMIRGIRNSIDLEYEFTIEEFTRATNKDIETIYFSPKKEHIFTSSSLVRNLINNEFKKEVKKYIPKKVFQRIYHGS
jgi:pantetheine-phosphate adenylyltransferase